MPSVHRLGCAALRGVKPPLDVSKDGGSPAIARTTRFEEKVWSETPLPDRATAVSACQGNAATPRGSKLSGS